MHRSRLYTSDGFYEFERWNYDGVADDLLPANPSAIDVFSWKANLYINYKKWFAEQFFWTLGPIIKPVFPNYSLRPALHLVPNYLGKLPSTYNC
ncbi:MAG: hypothetical protein AAGJ18_26285 [Bacteroidota bacterium]